MTLPTSYGAVLLLSCLAMLCLGSWLNTMKLGGKWRFELYYVDFSIGLMLVVALLALTLGETGNGLSFRDNLLVTGRRQLAFAAAAGGVFNLGNLLMVAAASLAGIAVAATIAVGAGLIVGVVLALVFGTDSSLALMVAGAVVMLSAILIDIRGFTFLAKVMDSEIARNWKHKHRRPPKTGLKSVWLSLAAGVFLGCSYPLAGLSTETELGLRPYAVAFLFGVGVICSTPVLVLLFMNVPVEGRPLPITAYLKAGIMQHLYGLAGGAIFATGVVSFLLATVVQSGESLIDGAGYLIIEASILVAALWGLLYWKEFKAVPSPGKQLMFASLAVIAVAMALIAFA